MIRTLFALIVLGLFLYIASPLILPVTMGAVFAVLLFPLLVRLEKWKVRSWAGATFLTLLTTVLFILPGSMLLFYVVKTGVVEFNQWKAGINLGAGSISSFFDMQIVDRLVGWTAIVYPVSKARLLEGAQELIQSTGLFVADLLASAMSRLPGMALSMAIIIMSIFFFLLDGRKLVTFFRRNSMFNPAQTEHLIRSMGGVCRSVVLASLVAGAVQALIELIALLVVGFPNAFMLGGLVFLASFIPLIGSVPVTFGVAAHQFLVGNTAAGVTLLVAALLVAVSDNFIRPLILKGTADLHPLLAFVAALGGLKTIGVWGIFLGPVIAALFVTTTQLVLHDAKQNT